MGRETDVRSDEPEDELNRLSPVNSQSMLISERVFQALKREIIECRLWPGDVINEAPIAAQYEVSKAPVREALKRLVELGLVRSVRRVGHMVAEINLHDFDEVYVLRIALEPLAVELATRRRTADELEGLVHLARTHFPDGLNPSESRRSHARVGDALHRAIARASHNGRLRSTIERLLDERERVVYLLADALVLSDLTQEHIDLVEAMTAGDGVTASEIMKRHLEMDYRMMRETMVSGPLQHVTFLHRPSSRGASNSPKP